MDRKTKFSIKFKEDVVKEHLQGRLSLREISIKYGISSQYLYRLVLKYESQGGFILQSGNNIYDKSFKLACVLSVFQDKLSLSEAALKFGIPSDSTIVKWIKLYRELGEDGLSATARGRPKVMSVPKKKKKKERSSDPKTAAMEEELEYLRAENAYLKKLNALVQQEELKASRLKSKPSKN